jgi:hypothetical protein
VKPRLVFDVPKLFSMINFDLDYATQGPVPDPFFQPACAAADPATLGSQAAYYASWLFAASSTTESGAPYGDFGTFPISGLAFGSIPITATIHLQQHIVDNVVTPIVVRIWSPSSQRGDDQVDFYAPCDHAFVPQYPVVDGSPVAITNATGQLDVSITNVTVDQQPVSVGSSCRSVTPIELNMFNVGSYYPYSGGELAQDSTNQFTLQNPAPTAPRPTDLTIPPFSGCGAGGDDLDPVINALIAGPGNKMVVNQGQPGGLTIPDSTACDTTTSACLPPSPGTCDPNAGACAIVPDYVPVSPPPS